MRSNRVIKSFMKRIFEVESNNFVIFTCPIKSLFLNENEIKGDM